MTFFDSVDFKDNGVVDAFGRLRVSEPHTIFDSKQIFDNQPLFWDESLESGGGISSAHSTDTASTVITSTINTAGKFTRQTFMRFNYQPGKSQLIYMTGVLHKSGAGFTGVQRRIGMFDDSNGIFFEDDEGTHKVVLRSFTSGSAVDIKVADSSWNLDVMDGSGPSGVTLDLTKAQIFAIDFEWLSVGRVRMGFVIAGRAIYVHEFLNANVLDEAYMSTPNLPLRYQMITTGSSPASSMECICASVMSEGGITQLGVLRSDSTDGTHVDANTENILYAILGMRLKTTHLEAVINIAAISIAEHQGNKSLLWQLLFNPTVAGSPVYADITNSAVQTFQGATANTVTGGTALACGFFSSGQKGGEGEAELADALRLGAAIDGTRDELVLAVKPVGGSTNADIEASWDWREVP